MTEIDSRMHSVTSEKVTRQNQKKKEKEKEKETTRKECDVISFAPHLFTCNMHGPP